MKDLCTTALLRLFNTVHKLKIELPLTLKGGARIFFILSEEGPEFFSCSCFVFVTIVKWGGLEKMMTARHKIEDHNRSTDHNILVVCAEVLSARE